MTSTNNELNLNFEEESEEEEDSYVVDEDEEVSECAYVTVCMVSPRARLAYNLRQ